MPASQPYLLGGFPPGAREQVSQLYTVLDRYILPINRKGPALSSLEALCELYLLLKPDHAARARIKIAQARGIALWFGFYAPEVDPDVDHVALELLVRKPRGVYGLQDVRLGLMGASEVLASAPEQLEYTIGLFSA